MSRKLLASLLDAFNRLDDRAKSGDAINCSESIMIVMAIDAINHELAKPESEPEPFGYINPEHFNKNRFHGMASATIWSEPGCNGISMPLYTSPQQQNPFTEDEIKKLYLNTLLESGGESLNESDLTEYEVKNLVFFVRAFEKAHGIGEK